MATATTADVSARGRGMTKDEKFVIIFDLAKLMAKDEIPEGRDANAPCAA